jgi:hypothetical protein
MTVIDDITLLYAVAVFPHAFICVYEPARTLKLFIGLLREL